ncbi:unnamed protein product, partial [marine sediment metagenome]
MSGAGAKPKLPPIEAPIPTPEAPRATVGGVGAPAATTLEMAKAEDVRKKLKSRSGRRGTILTTAGTLGEPLLQRP